MKNLQLSKKTSIILLVLMALMLLMPVSVFAATANDPSAVDVTIQEGGGLSVTGGGFGDGNGTSASAWNDLISKYKFFITGISGIGAVTMVILFIFQFMRLGASANNSNARSQALSGVLWTGIAAAGLGAVTIIVGFFYNAVR